MRLPKPPRSACRWHAGRSLPCCVARRGTVKVDDVRVSGLVLWQRWTRATRRERPAMSGGAAAPCRAPDAARAGPAAQPAPQPPAFAHRLGRPPGCFYWSSSTPGWGGSDACCQNASDPIGCSAGARARHAASDVTGRAHSRRIGACTREDPTPIGQSSRCQRLHPSRAERKQEELGRRTC